MPSELLPFALSVFFFLACTPRVRGVVEGQSDLQRESWELSILDGLRFVHCQDDYSREVFGRDEQTQLDWFAERKQCFGVVDKHFSKPSRFFRQLRVKINAWNASLISAKMSVLKAGSGTCSSSTQSCAKDRKCYQSRLLNAIWMIFRAQNITIAQFFLEKLLKDTNQKQLAKVIRILEKQGKVFDMTRYEKKMEAYEADLESINSQLAEKFEYFRKKAHGIARNKKIEIEYSIDYSLQNHLNTIIEIKKELAKVKLEWTQNEQKETNSFWTIDKRPIVRQTLWLVRHAEREDNIVENWCDGKDDSEKENSPLSARGLRQSEELGKWFATVNVDKVYVSPYKRCLQTANGLIGGEENPRGIGIDVEPGLVEFYGLSNLTLGFEEVSQSQDQFTLIDPNYWPIFNKGALAMMENERRKRKRLSADHDFVTRQSIGHILQSNGNAENIVLVSHMSNIGLLLELMGAEWAAVGQASVSKLVRYERSAGEASAPEVLRQFRLEYASGVTHLTQRFDMRPQ